MTIKDAMCLATALLVASSVAFANDELAKTQRPSGDYRAIQLELSEGLRFDSDKPSPQVVQLGFRGEKLVSSWIVGHGWHAMQEHTQSVRLSDKAIEGDLNLRMYDGRGKLLNTATLLFNVASKDGAFSGKMSIKLASGKKTSWEAAAQGSVLKSTGAFNPRASWSDFAGPSGSLAASKGGPALVDDLAKSKLLWRSESFVPVSYGNAADDRYPTRAAGIRSCGGSSSPVYADGVVYIAFYVPSRSVEIDWGRYHEKRKAEFSGEAFKNIIAERKLIDVEIAAIEDHWRPLADEVVVAMDARTGATLWRTTWPLRAYNLQTHKHRGTFGVPLVAGGKLFYPGFNGAIQVMDAKSGKALWEFPKYEKPPQTKHRPKGPPSQSPLLMGETVIWSVKDTTYGLAAETGKVVWESKTERYTNHSLRSVELGDRNLVLVVGHQHYKPSQVRLIDPENGSTLWSQEAGMVGTPEGQAANLLAIAGDKLVAYCYKLPPVDPKTKKYDKSKVTEHVTAWRLSEKGMARLWEDAHIVRDEAPHMAVANGVVYAVGKQLVRCLDLETGKVVGQIARDQFPKKSENQVDAPGSNPLLMVVDKKLILSPEGQHGTHGFVLFDADPTKLTLLGSKTGKWIPPHATTTAYGRQPIVNPIVDGRMFFRGGNGIYCYDLRKQN